MTEIRQAKLYDIPAVARIEEETSATPWSAASLTSDVTTNDKAYMAVITEGPEGEEVPEVVGYADMWKAGPEAQLNNIAIESGSRGRGLGSLLLDHMIGKARELGCEVMTLDVRPSNTAARALYEAAGFRQYAVRKRYYRNNHEDAILMEKYLSDVEVSYSVEI